jgi:hypothetical protein
MLTKRFARDQWDRIAGWACIGLGVVVLLLGWLGVSDTVYPAEQIPYVLSGGIFGLLLVGVGGILLLSADLRDEWSKLDSIEDAIRESSVDAWLADADSSGSRSEVPERESRRRRPIEARRARS